ncbi:unnamed protein product [Durusdinium trenchii]|uniref:Uncharacterized protein n=1 Tax=Durusdinium trenchii TaxID=1381693 RepID=A0ABP0J0I7_9DINO
MARVKPKSKASLRPHEGGGGGGTFLGAGSLVGGGGGGTPSVRIQGWQAKDTDASPKDTLNAASAPFVPRARIREHRVVGLITEWRGYMGWIQPLAKIEHELAGRHWGLLYVNQSDVKSVDGLVPWMKAGRIVDFYVYADPDGLGAEEVQALWPLRVTLSQGEAKTLMKGWSPHWSEYLTESEYYTSQHLGVLVRKYSWPLPFVVLELWGLQEELAQAAEHCSSQGSGDRRRLALLLPETSVPKAEHLPGKPKVSTHAVLQSPPCRSLTLEASSSEVRDAVIAFLRAMQH